MDVDHVLKLHHSEVPVWVVCDLTDLDGDPDQPAPWEITTTLTGTG